MSSILSRDLRETSFIVIDVETTGMSAENNRITEIALLRVQDGKIVDTFETLLNPEQYISPFIAEYTGITNAMVFGKPTFAEMASQVEKFIATGGKRPIIVGHNVTFDYGFLKSSFLRAGARFPFTSGVQADLLCTCRLARRLLPKLARRSLKHVADHFGIRIKARHRAMGDAEATAKVLIEYLEMCEEELELPDVEELLKLQYKRPTDPVKRTKASQALRELVKEFPERPGVYTMYDNLGEVIYVGKAKSLKDRVSSYFTASNILSSQKQARMMKAVKKITYEETGSELSAILRESRLIKEIKPRFNSLERRYRSYTFLKLDVNNPFPKLEATREPASDGAEYYGPFRSRASVSALVDVLNRSFTLRECGEEFTIDVQNQPCFYYEIERCKAPCAKLITQKEYKKEVDRLREFLSAGENGVLAFVEQMMHDAAERLDFEEAQFLKERLFEMRRVLGDGEQTLSSLNAKDFVIMTRTPDDCAEVFFVRYGKLAKQIVLTKDILDKAEEWFYRQLRLYYFSGASAIPPQAGKNDIDEIRILASWAEKKKRQGSTIVYVEGDNDRVVPKLVRELRSILGTKKKAAKKPKEKQEVKDEKSELETPLFRQEAVTVAKRLTLKPMFRR